MYTSPEVVKMIVGNKVDKETFSREVSTKEGEEFAKRMNCLFIGESRIWSTRVGRWLTVVCRMFGKGESRRRGSVQGARVTGTL